MLCTFLWPTFLSFMDLSVLVSFLTFFHPLPLCSFFPPPLPLLCLYYPHSLWLLCLSVLSLIPPYICSASIWCWTNIFSNLEINVNDWELRKNEHWKNMDLLHEIKTLNFISIAWPTLVLRLQHLTRSPMIFIVLQKPFFFIQTLTFFSWSFLKVDECAFPKKS